MKFVNTVEITIDKLAERLGTAYELRLPIMIWGSPGIGKSQIIEQFCRESGLNLVVKMLSQTEPGDLLGLPKTIEKEGQNFTTYATPDWLPVDADWKGIIFLDEIPEADDRLRAPAYQLLNDRRLGNYQLPPGAWVVGAGNPPEDGALYAEMSRALSDRFCHFFVLPNVEVTLNYAQRKGWHPAVIAYLKYQPANLYASDENMRSQLISPSPRSWERVSTLLNTGAKADHLLPFICGYLGEAVGSDFYYVLTWVEEVPPVTELLKMSLNQIKKLLPADKPSVLYTVGYNLAKHCQTAAEYAKAVDIMTLISSISSDELGFALVEILLTEAFQRNPKVISELSKMPSMVAHIEKFQEINK